MVRGTLQRFRSNARATPAHRATARVVVVLAKKNAGGSKKKTALSSAAAGHSTAPENVASSTAEEAAATVVVVVEKQRTAYRQPKKTPEQRAAERQQQAAELHEARKLPLEAVKQNLTRQRGKRVTLVDAYNVIGSWPELTSLPTLMEKRQKLEQSLAAYASINRCLVDLVYDSMKAWGQPRTPRLQRSPASQLIIVTFSGKQSADEVLKQHATYWAGDGGAVEAIVVSNDKQVQQDCTRPELDMMALSTQWLRSKCQEAEKQLRRKSQQEAERAARLPSSPQARLGVASWAEALSLPDARLQAAGLSVERVLELMAQEARGVVAARRR